MSIIRSGSNPEGLYMLYSRDGVDVYGDGPWFTIPKNKFNRLVKKFVKAYAEADPPIKIEKDLSLTQLWVEDPKTKAMEYKFQLRYKKHRLIMWSVTWHYIVENVMRRDR